MNKKPPKFFSFSHISTARKIILVLIVIAFWLFFFWKNQA